MLVAQYPRQLANDPTRREEVLGKLRPRSRLAAEVLLGIKSLEDVESESKPAASLAKRIQEWNSANTRSAQHRRMMMNGRSGNREVTELEPNPA